MSEMQEVESDAAPKAEHVHGHTSSTYVAYPKGPRMSSAYAICAVTRSMPHASPNVESGRTPGCARESRGTPCRAALPDEFRGQS